jgi:hypothetical protein
MPSLAKTLPRWYWAVRALMNRLAPISGFDSPSRASRLDQLRQDSLGRAGGIVIDHCLRVRYCLCVVSAEQAGHGDDVPADVRRAVVI